MLPQIIPNFTNHVVAPARVDTVLVYPDHQRVPAPVHYTARPWGPLPPHHYHTVHSRARVEFTTKWDSIQAETVWFHESVCDGFHLCRRQFQSGRCGPSASIAADYGGPGDVSTLYQDIGDVFWPSRRHPGAHFIQGLSTILCEMEWVKRLYDLMEAFTPKVKAV